jgi:peroxiredoxin/mono/diheme cytochrome c family protein
MRLELPRISALFALLMSVLALAFAATVTDAKEPSATASPLGRQIADCRLSDFRGKEHALADLADRKAIVVAFVGVECPLVAHYAPRLAELATRYEAQGVAVVAIDSNQQDSLTELAAFARRHKLEFPVLKDPGNQVADAFGAERTPEVFLLDQARRVVYHGRIDDQFNYAKQRPEAEHTWLVDALDQLLAGEKISAPSAESIGCHIGRVLNPQADSPVTYSKQIARIFQDRCVSCHRPGEIAPFALTDYDEVVGWAAMIREVVQERRMPPWHANPAHGKFANDSRLTDEEKSQIVRWVEAGAPEGDKKDLPPPREFAVGWQIGQPDVVVKMADKPFSVPAKGEVRYQYFVVDPGFKEDKWVQMAECRPGNRAVVHHIIVGVVPPGSRPGEQTINGLHSDWLTATAPGARPLILRDGMAKLIPASSRLFFQMHYTPNGTAQEDLSCVGLKFADPKTVKKHVGTDKAVFQALRIPPGAESHRVEAFHRFDRDMLMLAMFPHMHLRGKAFRYTALYPNGESEILLDVPHYDFAWQNHYEFAEPKRMPAGTRLHCEAWYDNSENNLANPDPKVTVRWGDQTWEEMMIGYFDATPADEVIGDQTGLGPRTEKFLALANEGHHKQIEELRSAAAKALESEENLNRFGPELRKIAPQLDRLCWTVIEGEKLHVRRCVQEPELEKIVGGAGRKVDVRITRLASLAERGESAIHADLSAERAIDLKFMARAYKSSLHVPVEIDGVKGTLNFWSTEASAFPPSAVTLLEDVARAMTARTLATANQE